MITIIIKNSPCECRNYAAEHYCQLTQATDTIPKHNVLLIIIDFNSYIGSHDTDNKFTFHQSTNGKIYQWKTRYRLCRGNRYDNNEYPHPKKKG